MQFGFPRADKSIVKSVVLLARHGAVEVIRIPLAVSRCKKCNVKVDGLAVNDRRSSVKKVQSGTAKLAGNILRHRSRSQRTCRNYGYLSLGNGRDLTGNTLN